MNSSPIQRLVELILYSIQENGLEETNSCLEKNLKSKNLTKNQDAKIVLSLVCSHLQVTEQEILAGSGRKGNRVMALGFCSYFLHYRFGYAMEDVQDMLSKDIELLYKYSKKIKNFNPLHRNDKSFIEVKNVLDQKIDEILENRRKNKIKHVKLKKGALVK